MVGLTLFSTFFRAGNPIFSLFLGVQAGSYTWIAMAGFVLSAIGFSVLGVVAVARSGGLDALAGRMYPIFVFAFTLLVYLSIEPCLAISRTASTSLEMAVTPLISQTVLGGAGGLGMAQLPYSAVSFLIAPLLALEPGKLSDRLGKIPTPCLLTLILLTFVGCMLHPIGGHGSASGAYERNPMVKGFLEGYLATDIIAALNFGITIALNTQAMGVTEKKAAVLTTVKAGVIMGIVLMAVYSALAYVGAMTGKTFGVMENGAQTLNRVVQCQFGNVGAVILAVIFFITRLNICVELLGCCSRYFCTVVPRVRYRTWVFLFTGASLVISNTGLNRTLEIPVPVLNMIYPVTIVLIVLAFLHPLTRRPRLVYPVCALFTGGISIGSETPALAGLMAGLPFYDLGLQWIVPAVVGGILGASSPSVWKKCGGGEYFPE